MDDIGELQASAVFDISQAISSLDELESTIEDATGIISSAIDKLQETVDSLTVSFEELNASITESMDKATESVNTAVEEMTRETQDGTTQMKDSWTGLDDIISENTGNIGENILSLDSQMADSTTSISGSAQEMADSYSVAMDEMIAKAEEGQGAIDTASLGIADANISAGGSGVLDALGGISPTGIAATATAVVTGIGIFDYAKMQQDLFQIKDFVGLSEEQIGQLSNYIDQESIKTGKSFDDIAQGAYQAYSELSSIGRGGEVFDAINVGSELAAMTGSKASDMINLISRLMNNFGVTASQAGDDISAALTKGNIPLNTLTNNFSKIQQLSKDLRTPLNETLALFALISQSANASQTQTEIKGAMLGFLKPSPEMTKAASRAGYASSVDMVDKLGLIGSIEKLESMKGPNGMGLLDPANPENTLTKIFRNSNAISGVADIVNSTGTLNSIKGSIDNSKGTTQKDFNDFQSTPKAEELSMWQELQKILREVGGAFTWLGQEIGKVVSTITGTSAFKELTNEFKTHKQAVTEVVNVLKFLGEVIAIVIGATIAGSIAIVIGLAAAFIQLWDVGDKVVNFFKKTDWGGIWNNIKEGAVLAFKTIVNQITSIPSQVTSLIAKAATWGSDMITSFINGIKKDASKLVNAIKDAIPGPIKALLHFSKPDEGPLADIDTWMPDMISLLVQGVNQNGPKLAQALQKTLSGVTANLAMGEGGGSVYNNTAMQTNNYNINGADPWNTTRSIQRANPTNNLTNLLFT